MKLRYTPFIISIILLGNNVFGQQWIWSRHYTMSTNKPNFTRGIVLDNSNNVYVTGQYKAGAVDIGAPSSLPITGTTNSFLVKYNENGGYLWHERISCSGKAQSNNVILDDSGNPVVAGFYDENVTIGPDLLNVYNSGYSDSYLAKFNSDGSYQWAYRVAYGPSDVKSQNISRDNSGNIYMVGNSTDTIYFSNDTLVTTGGRVQNFIAKFDPNGGFLWAKQITTNYTAPEDRSKFIEITAANDNEIYAAGFFVDSIKAEGTGVLSQGSYEDIILMKFNGMGDLQWMRQAGTPNLNDRCNGVETDIYGNVYITGYITGTAYFDSTAAGALNSSPISTAGSADLLVAKYNKNGTLKWKAVNGDTGEDIGYGAYIHENIIQFTGNFSGTVIFGNDTLRSSATTDENTGFFTYNTNGYPIAAQGIDGSFNGASPADYADRCENITYDNAGNTYLAGIFVSDTLFIGDSVFLKPNNKTNSFIAKFKTPFTATYTYIKNITCNGGNDGKLIVTPYFGTGPYSFSWSGNVSSSIDSAAFNLSSDTYSVTITDSRDSTATAIITLTEPSPILITLDSTNVSCYNGQDGAIDITVIGGTVAGDYSYAWTGAGGLKPTEGDQTNLFAGKFKVTVTDDKGCSEQDSTNVIQPDEIHFAGTIVNPAIPTGTNTGSIDLEVQGGTPNYAYAWEMGGIPMPGRTNDTLNNLYGANYKATITDDNGCVADTTINVPDQDNLGILIFTSDVSCYGLSDGSAYVSVVSGDKGQPYTYYWEDAVGTPMGTDSIITGISAGRYYVTVTEVGGDARVSMDNDTIMQPDSISLNITPTHVKCYGKFTGAVTMATSGGTPLYDYDWSSGHTTESFANVPAGKYSVLVTDANGCTAEDSTEITQPDSIAIAFSVLNPVKCFGALTGQIQANVSGGSGTFNFLWDDPGTQTDPIATGLEGGFYTLEITDAINNCIMSDTITLGQPAQLLIAAIDTHHVECYQTTSGSINLAMAGGTPPYQFDWSAGKPDTNFVENLGVGIYSVSVSDFNDCEASTIPVIEILGPSSDLSIDLVPDSDQGNSCFGDAEGEFEVTAGGGWGNYEFSINGTDWQASGVFTSLPADFYRPRVRDNNGCVINIADQVNITEPNELNILSQFVIGTSIIITANGGTSPYSYSLNGDTPQSSGQFDDLINGTYTIEITDENNCGPISTGSLNITTGLDDELFSDGISVYPNPTDGPVYIEFNAPEFSEFDIEIYNISGEKVIAEKVAVAPYKANLISVDLTDKGSGLYFIKINGIELDSKILVK